MKKIVLLLLLPLTILMADLVLTKDHKLHSKKQDTTTPTTPTIPTTPITPTPAPTPAVGGVIPNSTDLIWADMHEANTGFTSASSYSYPQTRGAYTTSLTDPNLWLPAANIWLEIEEAGMPNVECSASINEATNTRVEIGLYRGWWLDYSGNWHPMTANNDGKGSPTPAPQSVFGGLRGCEGSQDFIDERAANWNTVVGSDSIVTTGSLFKYDSATKHSTAKPDHYTRWHGFAGGHEQFKTNGVLDPYACKAIFGQIYTRLVVEDTTKPDDRNKAHYVVHLGIDDRNYEGSLIWGGIGLSRFNKITNEWMPTNVLSGGITKAELEANPPPFTSEP